MKLKLKRKIFNNKGHKKVKQTSTNNYKPIKSFQNSCNRWRNCAFLGFYLDSIYYSFDLSFEFDEKLIPEESFDLHIQGVPKIIAVKFYWSKSSFRVWSII